MSIALALLALFCILPCRWPCGTSHIGLPIASGAWQSGSLELGQLQWAQLGGPFHFVPGRGEVAIRVRSDVLGRGNLTLHSNVYLNLGDPTQMAEAASNHSTCQRKTNRFRRHSLVLRPSLSHPGFLVGFQRILAGNGSKLSWEFALERCTLASKEKLNRSTRDVRLLQFDLRTFHPKTYGGELSAEQLWFWPLLLNCLCLSAALALLGVIVVMLPFAELGARHCRSARRMSRQKKEDWVTVDVECDHEPSRSAVLVMQSTESKAEVSKRSDSSASRWPVLIQLRRLLVAFADPLVVLPLLELLRLSAHAQRIMHLAGVTAQDSESLAQLSCQMTVMSCIAPPLFLLLSSRDRTTRESCVSTARTKNLLRQRPIFAFALLSLILLQFWVSVCGDVHFHRLDLYRMRTFGARGELYLEMCSTWAVAALLLTFCRDGAEGDILRPYISLLMLLATPLAAWTCSGPPEDAGYFAPGDFLSLQVVGRLVPIAVLHGLHSDGFSDWLAAKIRRPTTAERDYFLETRMNSRPSQTVFTALSTLRWSLVVRPALVLALSCIGSRLMLHNLPTQPVTLGDKIEFRNSSRSWVFSRVPLLLHWDFATLTLLPKPLGFFSECDHVPHNTKLLKFDGNRTKLAAWYMNRNSVFAPFQPIAWLAEEASAPLKLLMQPYHQRDRLMLSSGCIGIFLAMSQCSEVNLYGFGPDGPADGRTTGSGDSYGLWGAKWYLGSHDFMLEHALFRGLSYGTTLEDTQPLMQLFDDIAAGSKDAASWRRLRHLVAFALECSFMRYPGIGQNDRMKQIPKEVTGSESPPCDDPPQVQGIVLQPQECYNLAKISFSGWAVVTKATAKWLRKQYVCKVHSACRCPKGETSCRISNRTTMTYVLAGDPSQQRPVRLAGARNSCPPVLDAVEGVPLFQPILQQAAAADTMSPSLGPEAFYVPRRWSTCALVGSGTDTVDRGLGDIIDSHEQVWRFNRVPELLHGASAWGDIERAVRMRRDLGSKVDLVITNHNAWRVGC